MHIIGRKDAERIIGRRIETGHKGTFGRVVIVGGNRNMGGAAIMATQAAVRAGAGLTTCITHEVNLTALHTRVPEAMFISFDDHDALRRAVAGSDVTVVGPGLGTDSEARLIFSLVLENAGHALIIDGSAITLLARDDDLRPGLPDCRLVFTPHEIEWQRLSGLAPADQTPENNARAASGLHADVVLKKHGTEIYHLSGLQSKLETGGPYMATGGMGDTLTGICAAFMAQFAGNSDRVLDAAVYTHSAVAEELSHSRYVVLPSDIADNLQSFMKGCADSD